MTNKNKKPIRGIVLFTVTSAILVSTLFYSCSKDKYVAPEPISYVKPSNANAGPDQTILLPKNSATLDGINSWVSDASTPSYSWTQVSGAACTMTGANTHKLVVSGLVAGSYVFRLTYATGSGVTSTDEATVTVK